MANSPLSEFKKSVNTSLKASYSENTSFDFIVIGLGSMGASTIFHLASQGYSVLGLEKHEITHENGSHTGQSRLIRQAYFEHPNYVPLLKEAYTGWDIIEKRSNSKLFYKTGILYSGKSNDFLISGSLESAKKHSLNVDRLDKTDITRRFPQFHLPSHYTTIFEPNAGFITPERAILTYIGESLKLDAEVHTNEPVLSYKDDGNSTIVKSSNNTYRASKVIITSGARTSELLPFIQPKLKVTKQLLFWVNVVNNSMYEIDNMSCWGVNQEEFEGLFYGFPILNNEEFGGPHGMKIGYHYPGETVDIDEIPRTPVDQDLKLIEEFMNLHLPGCFKSLNEVKSCLYTYSPDEHFILDHHPEQKNVIFATGFSGHGFKFIPVIGKILSELAIDGYTHLPADFLSLDRFTNNKSLS